MTETEIQLVIVVHSGLADTFQRRLRCTWNEAEYPQFIYKRDTHNNNIFYITHHIQAAIDHLSINEFVANNQRWPCLTEADQQILEQQLNHHVTTIDCEPKRYGSFDDSLIQYPIFRVTFYQTKTKEIIMELISHNRNEAMGIASSLSEYCHENTSGAEGFSWQLLKIPVGERNVYGGIIRIKGNIYHALKRLEISQIQLKHCGSFKYVYSSNHPFIDQYNLEKVFRAAIIKPDKYALLFATLDQFRPFDRAELVPDETLTQKLLS